MRVTMVRRVKTGCNFARAQFSRLLGQIIRWRFLHRREQPATHPARPFAAPSAARRSTVMPRLDVALISRQPFAIAAIEQQHPVACFGAQDMKQIMALALVQRTAPPGSRAASTKSRVRPPASFKSEAMPHLNRMSLSSQAPADAVAQSWVESSPRALRPYLQLMRLDRPIGSWLLFWPCVCGLVLGAMADERGFTEWRDLYYVALFGIGTVVMRGAGCAFNDIVDRKFDAQVARTRGRPIPSGARQRASRPRSSP